MSRLVLLQEGQAIPYALNQTEAVIGRHPDCDIHLESNMISRRHAAVRTESGHYFIKDVGSGNGTFVNGKKIEQEIELQHEDRIKLGPILLRFERDAKPAVQNPTYAETVSYPFQVDIEGDSDGASSIMSSIDSGIGFGSLNINPEAKLKAVLEISRSLAGTVNIEKILPKILDTLFEIFPHADRGSILLKDPHSGKMIPSAQKHRRDEEDETVKLSRTILDQVLNDKKGILSADASSDSRFEASESISNLTIRSMMCVPLLSLANEPMGIINIDTQNPLNQFKEEDIDLLLAVAGQAALSYESAQLMSSYLEKQKQDSEMKIAQSVQRALLPENLPDIPGYKFFASYDAAQAVGGDYYDAMLLGEDKICLSFGDVAGKGVPGALIMSRISSCVQNTMKYVTDVQEAFGSINNHMCDSSVAGRFVTYVLVIIDLKTNEMTLCDGGHMSPLIRRIDGAIDEFPEDFIGLPVGVMEDYPYEVETRKIEPGETIVIVTDGVDEAMNPAGELYSKQRVLDFISNGSADPEELGKALLADVRKHADGRPQNDDITIMTFGRLS